MGQHAPSAQPEPAISRKPVVQLTRFKPLSFSLPTLQPGDSFEEGHPSNEATRKGALVWNYFSFLVDVAHTAAAVTAGHALAPNVPCGNKSARERARKSCAISAVCAVRVPEILRDMRGMRAKFPPVGSRHL
jgi:hypothetical protein